MIKHLLCVLIIVLQANCFDLFKVIQPFADTIGLGKINTVLDKIVSKGEDIFVKASQFCPPFIPFCKAA